MKDKLYKICPQCGLNNLSLEYEEYEGYLQHCLSCGRRWDLYGNSLEAKEADEETKKLVRSGWTNKYY